MYEKLLMTIAAALLAGAAAGAQTVVTAPEAPFEFAPLEMYDFPDREFPITRYGARRDDAEATTKAFSRAMEACSRAGGGKVVVPEGEWLTGPIHLKSNVNLHLEEGATVRFTDNPADYLPAVMVSWEGLECYNYSPLVYAFGCENIAITGKGTLAPKMDTWRVWFQRPKAHLDALAQLYSMGSTDVPVEYRQMARGENHLRPHLIHFNRCNRVMLDGFKIRESPFWTIHLYLCNGGTVRNLDVKAHGHNNDGIDPECSRNILIEDIEFNNGDDNVAIKSGRDNDGWTFGAPSENIVIRRCRFKGLHAVVIGSEMSAGVRNVFVEDCTFGGYCKRGIYIKTNPDRGGFVTDLYVKDCEFGDVEDLFYATSMYAGEGLDNDKFTRVGNIYVDGLHCRKATGAGLVLQGTEAEPIRNVLFSNVEIGEVKNAVSFDNTVGVEISDCHIGGRAGVPSQAK